MPRQLTVWLLGTPVGTLAQINGRLGFVYAPDWLAQSTATPLSQSLPLQAEWFDDRATRPFFAGLLLEGEQRARQTAGSGGGRAHRSAPLWHAQQPHPQAGDYRGLGH